MNEKNITPEIEAAISGMADLRTLIIAAGKAFDHGDEDDVGNLLSLLEDLFEVRYTALCDLTGVFYVYGNT